MNYNQYTKAGHTLAILFGVVMMILWLSVADDDYQHELDELADACEMHRIWLDGAYARVPIQERNGWPITVKAFNDKCGVGE